MGWIFDAFLHLDQHLNHVVAAYGAGWAYLLLFVVIFCETGLVVTPFLPGDSLLFAVGALAATKDSSLSVGYVFGLLGLAAVTGNMVNYAIGWMVGPKVFHKEGVRWLNRKHLEQAHRFYEKYGALTIIITRFAPILRTFAPFVAGIGRMSFGRFAACNIIGGLSWVGACVLGGYCFGNIPVVKDNFSLVVLAIVAISLLPALVAFLRARRTASAQTPASVPMPADLPARKD